MNLLTALLLSIIPADDVKPVHMVEVNHTYRLDTGEKRFVQVIIWNRHPGTCLHVANWAMESSLQPRLEKVVRLPEGPSKYHITVWDGASRVVLVADAVKVSHTFSDPEELDRFDLEVNLRRSVLKHANK